MQAEGLELGIEELWQKNRRFPHLRKEGKKKKNEEARMFIMLPGLLSERTFMSVLEYFMMTDQSGCYKQVQIQRVSKQALFLTDTAKKT